MWKYKDTKDNVTTEYYIPKQKSRRTSPGLVTSTVWPRQPWWSSSWWRFSWVWWQFSWAWWPSPFWWPSFSGWPTFWPRAVHRAKQGPEGESGMRWSCTRYDESTFDLKGSIIGPVPALTFLAVVVCASTCAKEYEVRCLLSTRGHPECVSSVLGLTFFLGAAFLVTGFLALAAAGFLAFFLPSAETL